MKKKRIELLDHGYVELVDVWGRENLESEVGDEAIIAAARMSTQKGFEGWGPKCETCGADASNEEPCPKPTGTKPLYDSGKGGHMFRAPGDEKLLAYLWNNQHSGPFEFCGATFEIQAPIFVFREWMRHRTKSYNEMSARYAPLPDLSYVPSIGRLMMNAGGTNRQAGTIADAEQLTEDMARALMDEERSFNEASERFYQKKLKAGVPKELARTHIGVSRYSRMRASANLRNWLAFLKLRMDKAAQWEIRQFANAAHDILRERFPRTLELFDGRRSC